VARREPRADTAATAVVVFAVANVDYIIVLSVLFARRDLRFLIALQKVRICGP
jgi:cadmium resistance protein CadD (predicted permease)